MCYFDLNYHILISLFKQCVLLSLVKLAKGVDIPCTQLVGSNTRS